MKDKKQIDMEPFGHLGRFLIIAGVLLIIIGAFLMLSGKFPLIGKLPGDIVIEKKNFRLYFPFGTSILISIVLTILLWLVSRR